MDYHQNFEKAEGTVNQKTVKLGKGQSCESLENQKHEHYCGCLLDREDYRLQKEREASSS